MSGKQHKSRVESNIPENESSEWQKKKTISSFEEKQKRFEEMKKNVKSATIQRPQKREMQFSSTAAAETSGTSADIRYSDEETDTEDLSTEGTKKFSAVPDFNDKDQMSTFRSVEPGGYLSTTDPKLRVKSPLEKNIIDDDIAIKGHIRERSLSEKPTAGPTPTLLQLVPSETRRSSETTGNIMPAGLREIEIKRRSSSKHANEEFEKDQHDNDVSLIGLTPLQTLGSDQANLSKEFPPVLAVNVEKDFQQDAARTDRKIFQSSAKIEPAEKNTSAHRPSSTKKKRSTSNDQPGTSRLAGDPDRQAGQRNLDFSIANLSKALDATNDETPVFRDSDVVSLDSNVTLDALEDVRERSRKSSLLADIDVPSTSTIDENELRFQPSLEASTDDERMNKGSKKAKGKKKSEKDSSRKKKGHKSKKAESAEKETLEKSRNTLHTLPRPVLLNKPEILISNEDFDTKQNEEGFDARKETDAQPFNPRLLAEKWGEKSTQMNAEHDLQIYMTVLKKRATVELPEPIITMVRYEVFTILQDVLKQYKVELGNNHRLTMEMQSRIQKLREEIAVAAGKET